MSTPTAHMQILPLRALTGAMWDEVWQLTCRFYDTERSYVESKLKAHDQIALFRSAQDGALVGMAAIQADAMEFEGRRLLMLFTSHAIVDERYRGQNLMQRAGVHTYLRSCLRHPLRRKFWVFDTFSYRSYLLLPRNLHEFWPRRDRPTPEWQAALMEQYGAMKYGDAWRNGVVQRSPNKRLLPQTASLGTDLLRHPDLAFFSSVNPGHAEGDMLLCLCPLNFANWWGIVARAVRRSWRRL
jgi:hypothetical protein